MDATKHSEPDEEAVFDLGVVGPSHREAPTVGRAAPSRRPHLERR
jgi:hypothetical protein